MSSWLRERQVEASAEGGHATAEPLLDGIGKSRRGLTPRCSDLRGDRRVKLAG
jgi:hypothetical protein